MRFLLMTVAAAFAAMTLTSCAKAWKSIEKRLDKIDERLAGSSSSANDASRKKAEEFYQTGLRLLRANQVTDAISAWEKAVEIYPDYAAAHFQLGLTFKKTGDRFKGRKETDNAKKAYAMAIIHYNKVVQLTPKDASVYNNLANVYYSLADYDTAIEGYKRAIAIKSDDPDYHYNLANAYGKKGIAKEAIKHYKEAIRIEPNYFDAYYNLANLYEKIKDHESAIRYYEEYVKRENRPSEARWVEKARQKVYKLRGGGAIY